MKPPPGLCRWCGRLHVGKCPRVKSIEYLDDGKTVKKVEFFEPSKPPTPKGFAQ
jgi:hypothetical protein